MAVLPAQQHGLLVLNKPRGPTSAQCIARVKRLGQKKIGHAGTLDPMARGVLLVLLGHATKISGHLMADGEKVYLGTLRLGTTTDTWDAEGSVTATAPYDHVTPDDIRREVENWLGSTEQEVPPYSAAKHQGQPLYKLSRAGRETPVKTKTVEISRAQVVSCDLPSATFRVTCSSGTYIRSLAHSLGMRLGCGAMLTELTREYSHPFGIDEAHELDAVLAEPERLPERVIPVTRALPHWPKLRISAAQEAGVRNGMIVPYLPEAMAELPFAEGLKAIMLAPDDTPVALAETRIVNAQPVWTVLRGLWSQ
ncbi:tRNA pseudouridine(55) synthase TruB [Nitratidesulfovibrio liaohensis]|uniref:tRNA pseudouridine synthase B n=1 Tax=Nitratidesulfovibrio liaohensis TaxID=2604158 RepID=A0ABY9R133_9BACT|nr:tRNA pseudouridine(55) synthase TruB [Nitratidesulfovibrio liaohensis]WMW64857.1 tRNA pseudouridine(55) synthase TruB [Nitratidesulfovibrio liaohensis]